MKPELLLPVGNPEAFYAAQEGGADAVFLGLRNFNARGRAKNFAPNQLQSILKETEKSGLKVYLTLNTLIKNNEIKNFLDMIYMLSQTTVSALIIQDLGALYLIRKFFPKFALHASTQMGFHNSLGTEFARRNGFNRIILARELTWKELEKLSAESRIGLEIFAHGALCYSFSGSCLFSSFLGGMSANRGLCRQPCRRLYQTSTNSGYFFSLKDNQIIDFLPEIMKLNIKALKIEGRMKSAEYVYQTAKAYRMAIDDPTKIEEARELLAFDLGREKTGYFLGGNVKNAFAEQPYTGKNIGKVVYFDEKVIRIKSSTELAAGNRLRFLPFDGTDTPAIKIGKVSPKKDDIYQIENPKIKPEIGCRVILVGRGEKKFRNKFSLEGKKLILQMPESGKKHILSRLGSEKIAGKEEIFVRIDHPAWLNKINFNQADHLILKMSREKWKDIPFDASFLKKNQHKILIQLPEFIGEQEIEFYQKLILRAQKAGISNFMISHISQMFLPHLSKARLSASEKIYILNDAAIQFLKEEKMVFYVYPLENDFNNLMTGRDRKGIVPLYFYPELFYSRMPMAEIADNFSDRDNEYIKELRNGFTIIRPAVPVSLMQYKNKLVEKGFRRFLLDLSYQKPNQNTFRRLIKKINYSQAEQPGLSFNFRADLR